MVVGASLPGPASQGQENEFLIQENETLKAEMTKLRSLVEKLIKEK